MTTFLSLLVGGISQGFVLALIALGFVIVYRATGVINFAGAAFLLLGTYLVAILHDSLGFAFAVIVALLATCTLAALVQVLLVARARDADEGALFILTLGVNAVLTTLLVQIMGNDVYPTGDPWGSTVISIGDVTIPLSRVVAIVVCAGLIGVLLALFRWTTWGLAMRAAATDREAASVLGVRLDAVALWAWIVGGATAVIGGIFMTSFPNPGLDSSAAELALLAFPVAVIGGLDSVTGALVAGLTIGTGQALAAGYLHGLPFVGQGLELVLPFLVMFVVLIVRPAGLFGFREIHRV